MYMDKSINPSNSQSLEAVNRESETKLRMTEFLNLIVQLSKG